MHGLVTLAAGGSEYAFRLSLEGIAEIEQIFDKSIFVIGAALQARTARSREVFEVLRVGLTGAGMDPVAARQKVANWAEERPVPENLAVAYQVALAGLMRVHSREFAPAGETQAPAETMTAST